MALPYFFEKNIPAHNTTITLSEETSKHCIHVLRMKAGEKLQLTDGCGNSYTATIITEDKRHCQVVLSNAVFKVPTARKITVAVSVIKNNNRLEWFIEKATEIGISAIVPLICSRTEKQHFRADRMQAILISAMLQSRQNWLPVLEAPIVFDSFINGMPNGQRLIAHCEEQKKQPINSVELENEVIIAIGPEGDFTTREIDLALKNSFTAVSLGNTRLRTETAALVAATLLIHL